MAESSSQQQNDADDGEICPVILLAGASPRTVLRLRRALQCGVARLQQALTRQWCGSQAERRSQASAACCL
jgi:hypothetical protein